MPSLIRTLTLPLLVAALAATACGGGEADDGAKGERFIYGADRAATDKAATTTVESVAAPPPSRPRLVATTVAPARIEGGAVEVAPTTTRAAPPRIANRSDRLDPSGLELTLVVADKVTFAPSEDMTLEVSFVNRTDRALYRNGAQSVFFEIVGAGRHWSTTSCQPDFGGQRPPPTAIPIEAGEPNRFVGTYPAGAGIRSRDQCRLPPGEYDVTGMVEWCPPDTITRPGGGGQACDPEADVTVRSAPVTVTIA